MYNLISNFSARERAADNFVLSTALLEGTSSFWLLASSTFSAGALTSSDLVGVTSTGFETDGAA